MSKLCFYFITQTTVRHYLLSPHILMKYLTRKILKRHLFLAHSSLSHMGTRHSKVCDIIGFSSCLLLKSLQNRKQKIGRNLLRNEANEDCNSEGSSTMKNLYPLMFSILPKHYHFWGSIFLAREQIGAGLLIFTLEKIVQESGWIFE